MSSRWYQAMITVLLIAGVASCFLPAGDDIYPNDGTAADDDDSSEEAT